MIKLRFGMGATATLAALMMTNSAFAQTVYVSDTGDDNNPGSISRPFKTVERAVEAAPSKINVSAGQYILESTLVVPAGVAIEGGFFPAEQEGVPIWFQSTRETEFLIETTVGQAGVILRSNESPTVPGASLEDLTIIGGYVGVQMEGGTTISEIQVRGATQSGSSQLASVLVDTAQGNRPTVIEGSRFFGGNTTVRIDGPANVNIIECLMRDPLSRAINITGDGIINISNTTIQGSRSDGISMTGSATVTITNSAIRRNTGTGIVVNSIEPIIRGCLIERNEHGIDIRDSLGGVIENSTIVNNRLSGVYHLRSFPDLRYNIIANNTRFGVEEDSSVNNEGEPQPTPVVTPTPTPTSETIFLGGEFEGNILHGNLLGAYLDAPGDIFNTTELVNGVNNIEIPLNNLVEDPIFKNKTDSDFRLAEGSPAIDKGTNSTLATDVDGNPRNIDIDDVGEGSDLSRDSGAYEYQGDIFRTNFGTNFYDYKTITDPLNPALGPAQVKENYQWLFNQVTPDVFSRIYAEFLPGRIQYYSLENFAFGTISLKTDELDQPEDKVAVVKAVFSGESSVGLRSPRIRFNGPEEYDISQGMLIEGSKELFPTEIGRPYEMVLDFRQGGYRNSPVNPDSKYASSFFIDMMNFATIPYQAKIDIRSLEVEFISRAVFDLRYNTELAAWTFESGIDDWSFSGIPGYQVPNARWDAGKGALLQTQTRADSFGSWYSPTFQLQPNQEFKIDIKVSTNSALPSGQQGFRLRLSPSNFSFSNDILITAFDDGRPAAPTSTSQSYTLYGKVPETIEADQDFTVFFDMWGFGAQKTAALFLEECYVYTVE